MPPITFNVPPDAQSITDQTFTIRVSVPADWSQTDTTPDYEPSVPSITASPDLTGFYEGFEAPGVSYEALPFQVDMIEALQVRSLGGPSCTDDGVISYDDGAFVGKAQQFSNCDGSAARVITIAANPPGDEFTALVNIKLTGASDDDNTIDTILSSFDVEPTDGGNTTPAQPQAVPDVPTPVALPVSGDDDRLQQAYDDFDVVIEERLVDVYRASVVPSCYLDVDGNTATCMLALEDDFVRYVGEWSPVTESFDFEYSQTPQQVAAEEEDDRIDRIRSKAYDAFTVWVTDTYALGLDYGDCSGPDDTVSSCAATTRDGRPISARVTVQPDPDEALHFTTGPDDYEFTADFEDVTAFDTPLTNSVDACVIRADDDELRYDDGDGYEVLDEGHSVVVNSAEAFDCLREQLGWPEWISAQVGDDEAASVGQTLPFDGFTISQREGSVIVYDETVSGT